MKENHVADGGSAPFIFFDGVLVRGLSSTGIGQLTLSAVRLSLDIADQSAVHDHVVVAHLRSSVPALRILRDQINDILAAAEPVDRSKAN